MIYSFFEKKDYFCNMRLRRFLSFWITMCCFFALNAAPKHKYTLVIDAGHGGKDAGACANGGMEKKINLDVALAFGRYVETNCPDVKVVYTRKTDVFIPLHERAAIANRIKADVFISIHTNSVASRKPIYGMETYTMGMRRSNEKLSAAQRENEVILIEKDYKQHYSGYDPRSPESTLIFEVINEKNMLESVELAQLIQQHTCAVARRPNKGVRQDAFLVLRETSMPACLIELGYITTPAEKNYLTNAHNVDLMGKGIYQAFVAFKNKQQGKSKSTSTPAATPKEKTVAEPVNNQEPAAVNKTRSVNAKNVPVRNAKNSLAAELEVGRPTKDAVLLKKVEQKAEQKVEQKKIEQLVVEPVAEPVKSAEESKAIEKPDTVAVVSQPQANQTPVQVVEKPSETSVVFKLQLFAAGVKVKAGDPRLKGLKDVDCFQEGGLFKHTIGSSSDYNEIVRLRKTVADKFPQAFIIAFRNGEKVDARKAWQQLQQKKK